MTTKTKTKTKTKVILSNILGFGSIDIFSLVIPIITMPILTRTIGIDNYGIYLFYSTVLVFGHTIVDYSCNINGIRAIATTEQSDSKIYSMYQSTRLSLLVLYCCLITPLYFLSQAENFLLLSSGTILYLFSYWCLPTWYLVAKGEIYYHSKVVIFSKIILLVLILFFVKDESDLWILIVGTSFPFFVIVSISVKYLKSKRKIPILQFSLQGVTDSLKSGTKSFIGIFSPNLYNNIPIIILGSTIEPASFTIFAIANRLSSICLAFQNTFAKAIFPVLAKEKNNNSLKLVAITNLVFSFISILFIYIIGDRALLFFLGSGYENVYDFLLVLLPGLIFTGLSFSLTHAYFLPRGDDHIFRNVSLIVSVLCFFLGLLLITKLSALGVAILITSARFLLFLGYAIAYCKNDNHSTRLKKV